MVLSFHRMLPSSLVARVFSLYTAIMLLLGSTSLWLFFSHQFRQDIEISQQAVALLAEASAPPVITLAARGDAPALQRLLERAVQQAPVASVAYVDPEGLVIKSENLARPRGGAPDWLRGEVDALLSDLNRPLTEGGRSYGSLRLSHDVDAVARRLWNQLVVALGLALAGLIGGLALIWLGLRRWLASIRRLSARLSSDSPQSGEQARQLVQAVPVEFRPTFETLQHVSASLRQELKQREQALGTLRRALANLMPEAPASGAQSMDIAALARLVLKVVQEREADRLALQEAKQIAETAMQAAENASRAKGEFLAVMSHEIRTPMNGIIGMTSLTLETELNAQQREYLSMVKNSADSLLSIINDILDFSKIEADQLTLDMRPLRPHSLVRSTLNSLDSQARLKGLRLAYEPQAAVPPHLIGDSGRLRQILVNLIGNAIKFSKEGIVQVRVLRQADRRGQVVLRFEVQDHGLGIVPEKQKVIFNPFTQADASITRHFGGTGLGLAICAKLVGAMEGEIGVQSTPGQGSTFFFTIPFDIDHTESNSDIMSLDRGSELPGAANSLRILLVEDNEVNRKLALSLLERDGHEVECVPDGAQAVDAATRSNTPYDLILMDMQMPVMDGLEATRRIRAHERNTREHVRIVAMTANVMVEDRERCLAAGMDEYLAKPIRIDELRAALRWQDADYNPTTPGALSAEGELLPPSAPAPALARSPAPSQAPAASTAFDYTGALAQADGMVVRIIGDSFRSNWPEQMRDMQQALAQDDAPLLQRSAHSLRGLLGNFGAAPAEALSRKIEVLGARGTTADAAPLVQQLTSELQALDQALARFLGQHA